MARLHTVSDTHVLRPDMFILTYTVHIYGNWIVWIAVACSCLWGHYIDACAFILHQTQICACGQTVSKTTGLQMYKPNFIIQYKQKQALTQMTVPVNSH